MPLKNSSSGSICLYHSHTDIYFLITKFRAVIYELLHKKPPSGKQSYIHPPRHGSTAGINYYTSKRYSKHVACCIVRQEVLIKDTWITCLWKMPWELFNRCKTQKTPVEKYYWIQSKLSHICQAWVYERLSQPCQTLKVCSRETLCSTA